MRVLLKVLLSATVLCVAFPCTPARCLHVRHLVQSDEWGGTLVSFLQDSTQVCRIACGRGMACIRGRCFSTAVHNLSEPTESANPGGANSGGTNLGNTSPASTSAGSESPAPAISPLGIDYVATPEAAAAMNSPDARAAEEAMTRSQAAGHSPTGADVVVSSPSAQAAPIVSSSAQGSLAPAVSPPAQADTQTVLG